MARAQTAHGAGGIVTNSSKRKDPERRELSIGLQGSRCGLYQELSLPSRKTHTAVFAPSHAEFATASGAAGTSARSASMRRSRSLPVPACRPVEPQRRCLVTPVLRKSEAPGRNNMMQQPEVASSSAAAGTQVAAASAAAAPVGGLLGAPHKGGRKRAAAKQPSKKLALPFAYPDEDPRYRHVELAESRSVSEACPEPVLPPLPSPSRPAQSSSDASWPVGTRPARLRAAPTPGRLPQEMSAELGM